MGVPGGGKGAGWAIAAVSVAELKFRLGWIARCAMQLGHQGWIAQIEQHPRTKRLA